MLSKINSYVSLENFKSTLGITSTTDDLIMRNTIEAATRSIESYTNRIFYVTNDTKYFDGARTLWVPDLLTITTLKTDEDGDATFENEFDTTDYFLYGVGLDDTLNRFPKIRIEINPNGDYNSFASGVKKGVEIAGEWGYGDGTAATPYEAVTTLSADVTTTIITTVNVTSVANISVGHTIKIDDEQMYVQSIDTLALTVLRATNGSTAATHTAAATIYVYRYPADISQACLDLSTALYQNRARQGLQSERIGDYEYTIRGAAGRGGAMTEQGMIQSMLNDTIKSYKRMRF